MSSDSFYQRQSGPGRKRRRALVIDAASQPPRPAVSADAKPSDLARKSLKRFAMVVGGMILLMFLSVKLLEHIWQRSDEQRLRSLAGGPDTNAPTAVLSTPRSLPPTNVPVVPVAAVTRTGVFAAVPAVDPGAAADKTDGALAAEKRFRWGKMLEQGGESEGALELYLQALTLTPADPLILSQAGRIYIRLARHDEAIPVLRRALDHDPDNADVMNDLGVALTFNGQAEEAVDLYGQLMTNHPGYTAAKFNQGYALVQLQRFEEARPLLEGFVEVETNNAMALGVLAVVEQAARNHDRALELLDRAIRLNPEWGTPYLDAAGIAAAKGDAAKAADYLERALAVASPADVFQVYNLPALRDLRASERGKALETRIAGRARSMLQSAPEKAE